MNVIQGLSDHGYYQYFFKDYETYNRVLSKKHIQNLLEDHQAYNIGFCEEYF